MKLACALIFLSALRLAAEKEKPLPKDLPAYGAVKPFTPPPVTEVKLGNGLTVWLVPVSGFPQVTLTVAVRGGYAADPKDLPGIGSLLADTMTQGTTTRTAREIAEELQGCGGDLSASAEADDIVVQTTVLAERTDTAMNLLSDVVQNATLSTKEVEVATQKAAAELDRSEASPRFLARRALYRAMFGDHPYAVISATKESIEKTTSANLKHEYTRRFRPDQAVLVMVGEFDSARITTLAKQYFGSWKAPATQSDVATPAVMPSVTKAVTYVARANSVQTSFLIGGFSPKRTDPDYGALKVANSIYGGMFGARLTLNIREDKGYTYSPYSFATQREKTGMLVTTADVRNVVTGASFNEISYELNRMATTSPEEDEIARGKRYLIGSMAVSLQSHRSLAQTLADYWVDSLTPGDLAKEGEKIEQVSAANIREAGRKYFPMWRMTTVAVGEEKVIREELAPFGLEFKKVK